MAGDLSALDGGGELTFDYRRFTNGGGSVLAFLPVTVTLGGPGGAARWEGEAFTMPTDWVPITVPFTESEWTITGGTWSGLLDNVTSLSIVLELVSNTLPPEDFNGVDNVRLTNSCGCIGDANASEDVAT